MTFEIPTVTKTSTSSQAHLLPSTSFVAVTTSSESQPSISLIDTVPATSNNLCTSVPSSLSNKTLSSSIGSIFSPVSAEASPVLEISITSNTIPSTSQAFASPSQRDRNSRTGTQKC
ncbi:hypothetical protein TNCV_601431 [Trichonephila clavipes]|nr:hypothetical protein TNCV_601431 [Trichonephila clavipes]